jgi:hypothetical protein
MGHRFKSRCADASMRRAASDSVLFPHGLRGQEAPGWVGVKAVTRENAHSVRSPGLLLGRCETRGRSTIDDVAGPDLQDRPTFDRSSAPL